MTDIADDARPKIIGARVQRVEDPRLLTGHGSYVDDRKVPGLLHVAFRRSEHAHARIAGIDMSAAAAIPGSPGSSPPPIWPGWRRRSAPPRA